ncbi:hypothetical protein DCAR_0414512 [Daucus carota subsp. sativus]|uniref:Replication protein A 70 kDa DNA-binding subunit B/D first OB fold domain-containing protein n=1 Tax=Daucus carota subsp. sativus TaxID=79200 RepID=A0A175YAZ8_DAUCS|nr:hypothetical protein DCAR_0414512 [Daucus carota subsp. sativus]
MQGLLFNHIQSLEKARINWKIKVRLTKFWPTIVADAIAVRGYNMIFLDEDNSNIHAYAYPDNWTAIGKSVLEGKVYVVENFQVRDSTGRLRPVSNKKCIRLLSSTTIDEVDDDTMIPYHKFEFMDLADLLGEAERNANVENPEFSTGFYMFRLIIMADDNNLTSNVLLSDRVVKRLIRTIATNVIAALKNEEANGSPPAVLKDIVGMEITVKILLSESNISGDSNIYQATDLFDPAAQPNMISQHSPIPKCPSFSQAEEDSPQSSKA